MLIVQTEIKGRCVFADKEYKKGDIIEVCEYITIPQIQIDILKKTVINDYWFWKDGDKWDAILLLGTGSLYNHSTDPNMDAVMSDDARIGFVANKDIADGDELVFDYWYTPHFHVHGNLKVVSRIKKT